MYIKTVHIKNFKSIASEKIEMNDLVVLIGNNDAGKSNYIKALNLFFNGQTDFNTDFDFEIDFCRTAKVGKQKAREIVITIEFLLPDTFKEKDSIIWQKVWRADGEVSEKSKITYKDGKEANNPRSRAVYWIRHLKFRYVPAIKSNEYFQELLGDVNDTLVDSVEKDIKAAATSFTQKIQETTDEITRELHTRIDLDSSLVLPNDLRQIFKTLDFNTKYGNVEISLNNRGDGIKSRHIPVVLKFLAEQDNLTRTQGAPKVETIWGFEEPENNLELQKAFELARDFYDYSKTIQIILSSHSSAFYNIKHIDQIYPMKSFSREKVTTYFVDKRNDEENSSFLKNVDNEGMFVDEKIGLLPLITPYIVQKIKENEAINTAYLETKCRLESITLPVLLTEGKTDPIILETAWSMLFPEKELGYRIISCNTTPQDATESAGASMLKSALNSHRPDLPIVIGLFDYDDEGNKEYKDLHKTFSDKAKHKLHRNKKCAAIMIPKIPGREKYFDAVNLPLEYVFPEEYVIRKNRSGAGLSFRQKKKIISIEGRTIEEVDSTEPQYRQIIGNKVLFAEQIVPSFPKEAFENFRHIFELIEQILNEVRI